MIEKNRNIKYSIDEIIEKFNDVHNNFYNYSLIEYNGIKNKIKIICPIHGVFEQTPDHHLRGKGCKECGLNRLKTKKKLYTKTQLINKLSKKHNNRYEYLLESDYYHRYDIIKIKCPIHGVFEQKIIYHLKGNGCKKCANDKLSEKLKISNEEFIERVKQIHNNFYDYSLVNYTDGRNKIKIKCPIHGVFEQKAKLHLYGSGCKKCANEKLSDQNTSNNKNFIEKSNHIHNNFYDYSLVDYKNILVPVTITCPIHGTFEQKPREHIQGKGCSKCNANTSKQENEIVDFLKKNNLSEIIENDRNILDGKELDIYLPDKNIAIEYCGLYWHSEKFVDKNYHLDKLKKCQEKNIRLITIFEDEWINKSDIIKSKLLSILGKDDRKRIYARKCKIKEIDSKPFNDFMNLYHIQGEMNCKYRFGLFYGNELVASLGFRNDKRGYDLNRYATKYNVVGGFSKLLKFFIREYKPEKIFTFADLRYSDINKNLYLSNEFVQTSITKPNYFYAIKGSRKSRVQYQKHKLKNKLKIYNDDLTEVENMANNNYYRIFDCGNIKYEIIF